MDDSGIFYFKIWKFENEIWYITIKFCQIDTSVKLTVKNDSKRYRERWVNKPAVDMQNALDFHDNGQFFSKTPTCECECERDVGNALSRNS